MRNSVSERSFLIESDDDDDAAVEDGKRRGLGGGGGGDDDDDGSDSSSPCDSPRVVAARCSQPSSYTQQWPQSYRQSIDMYSSVHSPNLSFLGTPSLSRLSNSFLTNSFRGKPPEIISSLIKPLLPTSIASASDDQQQQQHEDVRKSSHYLPPSRKASSLQRIPEDQRPMVGGHEVGPYRQCSYTQGVMNGVNVLCGVGILSTPYAVKQGGWLGLVILAVLGALAWYTGILLRRCLDSKDGLETYPDIGHAAFGTAGRIIISANNTVYGTIFESEGTALNLPGIPIAIGLYGYCYSGHGVFPNIYSSLKKSNQFPAVLFTCIALSTVLFAAAAIMGYIMFGESTESQFTLNLPPNLVASKIAVWTTVTNPITKYPWTSTSAFCVHLFPYLTRLVMSLVGSFLTMFVAYILPCACFLSILRSKVTWYQVVLCVFIIVVGLCCVGVGTYSSLSKIIQKYQ
ncbi:Transmembrane amino acid transporter family protein [Zea mays]|uniref:Transmembrane amino acid transporter family protein n=1 Tax=Zea mays TaxID=4577 RepID=A0A1D6EEV6_MAIZE|nr:Transmembrane amino acid transporter family protein [Zea mays]